MKKFISLMLLFAFASFTWAQDEEEEEEEEEEVVEVVKPKKAAKPAVKAGESRFGIQAGFNSSMSNKGEFVNFVYDFGTGLRLNIGLDAEQYTYTESTEATTKTAVALAGGIDYELGKQLLPFGIGGQVSLSNEPMNDEAKFVKLYPYFYVDAELVKNLIVTVKPGVLYQKPDGGDANITLGTSVAMTFYFL